MWVLMRAIKLSTGSVVDIEETIGEGKICPPGKHFCPGRAGGGSLMPSPKLCRTCQINPVEGKSDQCAVCWDRENPEVTKNAKEP